MSVPYDLLALTPRTHIDLQNVSISCFQHLLGWLDFRGAALAVPGLLAYLMVSKGSAPELLEANAKAKTVCLHGRYRSRSDVLTGLYFLKPTLTCFKSWRERICEGGNCFLSRGSWSYCACLPYWMFAAGPWFTKIQTRCTLPTCGHFHDWSQPELPGTCRLQDSCLNSVGEAGIWRPLRRRMKKLSKPATKMQ